MNRQLLKDEKFVLEVTEKIRTLMEQKNSSCAAKWERFKEEIKLKALERSSALHHDKTKKEALLRRNLETLLALQSQSLGLCKDDIKTVKQQLQSIEEVRYHGAIVRARAEKFLLGEAPTKRALCSEKRYATRNTISEIEFNGHVSSDQRIISNAFCEYYDSLFVCQPVNLYRFREDFMRFLPVIDDEVKDSLEVSITPDEVKKAIDDLNPGKSPGPDGLCAAFYKAFRDDLSIILCELYKEAYERDRLPPSFSSSHTVLIPKTDDRDELKKVTAYRPITLTNVDYKILMKILAGRLQMVITDIVGEHQTCGIKGRSITSNIHAARSILECCDSMDLIVAMLQIDLEKAFDKVSHEMLFSILEQVNLGRIIPGGVQMAYKGCSTSLVINRAVCRPIKVTRSVRQGCPLSPLLFCLYIEALCASVNNNNSIHGFRLQACEVRVLAYADDIAFLCRDRESISSAIKILNSFCEYTGSSVNWKKCLGFWHGCWDWTPSVFEGVSWQVTPAKYLGVPLENYRDSEPYWRSQTAALREKAEKWEGKGKTLSVFARATVCNVFLFAKLWYVLQVIHCSRANVQRLHRVCAVFIWGSTWERTSRTNLFRRVRDGGLSLSHLFLRQVVNRFYFLREVKDPLLRTVIQVRLGRFLPQFVITSSLCYTGGLHGYLKEVVQATQFVCSRFSMEYLTSVSKKKLYKDLVEICFPVPLYRSMFRSGPGQNVLKRVKAMVVPPGVKTFFFKLHVGVLPVKTWMLEKGLFVPWGADCWLCKKPETVEHVFLDCWDAVFLWDVLQRTLKKELPLDPHGIRFLAVENDNGVPYDLLMLLVLHGIWRSRLAARYSDVDGRPARQYFCESVHRIVEMWKGQPCTPEWLQEVEKVLSMPRF